MVSPESGGIELILGTITAALVSSCRVLLSCVSRFVERFCPELTDSESHLFLTWTTKAASVHSISRSRQRMQTGCHHVWQDWNLGKRSMRKTWSYLWIAWFQSSVYEHHCSLSIETRSQSLSGRSARGHSDRSRCCPSSRHYVESQVREGPAAYGSISQQQLDEKFNSYLPDLQAEFRS